MFEKTAIYAIEHVPSGLVYVGGAVNLSKRWSRHRHDLRLGIHKNPRLQAAYDADPASLRWRPLAVVPRGQLRWFEQQALDHFGPPRLLNLELTAGVNRTNAGKSWTVGRSAYMTRIGMRRRRGFAQLVPGDQCQRGHVIDGSRTRRRTRADGSTYESSVCQVCANQGKSAKPRRKRQAGDRCSHGHVIDGSQVRRNKRPDGTYGEPILRCQECHRLQGGRHDDRPAGGLLPDDR